MSHTDTERLDWYVRHVVEADESLCCHTSPLFGQVTTHDRWHQHHHHSYLTGSGLVEKAGAPVALGEVWYWPMDTTDHEFSNIRDAIDWRIANART